MNFIHVVVTAANRWKNIEINGVLHKEFILVGYRHWCPRMRQQADSLAIKLPVKHDQGFIDNQGKFLTRKEAMILVKKSGQPFDKERNGGSDVTLYSEGLY